MRRDRDDQLSARLEEPGDRANCSNVGSDVLDDVEGRDEVVAAFRNPGEFVNRGPYTSVSQLRISMTFDRWNPSSLIL